MLQIVYRGCLSATYISDHKGNIIPAECPFREGSTDEDPEPDCDGIEYAEKDDQSNERIMQDYVAGCFHFSR